MNRVGSEIRAEGILLRSKVEFQAKPSILGPYGRRINAGAAEFFTLSADFPLRGLRMATLGAPEAS